MRLHAQASSNCSPQHFGRGFTLVELMVSVSIMVLITGVMVLQFSSFDSTTILRAHTYEVAHSVRAAQSYAASIRGTQDAEFSYRYGISFSKIDKPEETNIFVYKDNTVGTTPHKEACSPYCVIENRTIPEGFTVTEICVRQSGLLYCNIESLDISFKRPEAVASFYAQTGGTPRILGIDKAIIKIQSGVGGASDTKGVIEVGVTGYVSVSLETP